MLATLDFLFIEIKKNSILFQAVGLFDIKKNDDAIESLKREFNGKSIEYFQTDVRSDENIKQSFEAFIEKYKFVDILIANAGVFSEINYKDTVLINMVKIIIQGHMDNHISR